MLGSQAIFVERKMAAPVYDLSDLPTAALSYEKNHVIDRAIAF